MRGRRRRLAGLAAAIAPAVVTQSPDAELTFPEGGPAVLGLTVSLGRSATTRAAVQVGAPPPRFTG